MIKSSSDNFSILDAIRGFDRQKEPLQGIRIPDGEKSIEQTPMFQDQQCRNDF